MGSRSVFGRFGIAALAVIIASGVIGCRSVRDYFKPKKARDREVVVQTPPNRAPAPLQNGLFLTAYAKGNLVSVILTNYTETPVIAGPKCFAVIPVGTRQVIPFRLEEGEQMMPIKTLNKGEGIQGQLRFKKLKDLVGGKLVYNSGETEMKPVFCVIQPARDEP